MSPGQWSPTFSRERWTILHQQGSWDHPTSLALGNGSLPAIVDASNPSFQAFSPLVDANQRSGEIWKIRGFRIGLASFRDRLYEDATSLPVLNCAEPSPRRHAAGYSHASDP